jgi:membrane dipeptidase
MDSQRLHESSIIIDGLQVGGEWPRELFEDVKAGGITAMHVTKVIWENASQALDDLGLWHRRYREHADIIRPVLRGDDILAAKAEGRVGVIYGFQNSSPFEDSLDYVWVFHTLGVRVVQLTYNNQSLLGGSCYEENDSGLTRFGRNVVAEMNRLGMIVDLSHVGERTSFDAIRHSSRPVAITHANPQFFREHKRNKSDALLKELAANGGVLGLTTYPNLAGFDLKLEDWCAGVARTAELIGIDHIGLGSDMARGWADEAGHINYARMGRWTHEVDYGAGDPNKPWGYVEFPEWYRTASQFPNLTEGLLKHGFSEEDVAKLIGGNWLRFYQEGLEPASA